jgi:hypothetical protein
MTWSCTRSVRPPRDVAPHLDGPIRSRDIVEGGRIFVELCTACHRGRVNPRGYHWSAGQMRTQIRQGNRLMPPLNREWLSDDQVEAVLAYLVIMGDLESELPPIPVRRERPDAGAPPEPQESDAGSDAGAADTSPPTLAETDAGDAGVGPGPADAAVSTDPETGTTLDPPP